MGVSETLYQLKAFNILCWHMLALDYWYHWKSSMLGALCIGWVSVTFDVVRRGVPSYMGQIWYSQSLAREIFLILKGNTISDHFPRYFPENMKLFEHLCQGGSYGFMSASVFLCHWKASILEVFINRSRSIDHHRITDQPWSVLYAQETDTEVMLSKRGINFSQKGGVCRARIFLRPNGLASTSSKHLLQLIS